jgi:endonuclease-3
MPNLGTIIEKLLGAYGTPVPPLVTDPFEMILLENVAYLVRDEKRIEAFENLKRSIGIRPEDILTARPQQFESVRYLAGSDKNGRIAKLIRSAEIARDDFDGDLKQVLAWPFTKARAALQKFPSIGRPGAEKILMYNKGSQLLALDSNGLRVLLRVGFGAETKDYSATYTSVQTAIDEQNSVDPDLFVASYELLRKHGQTICRRTNPGCEMCVLREDCNYGRTH